MADRTDPESSPDSAAVLESMTLLATLATATDVRNAVADRRAGRDPSAQEPAGVAAAHLRESGNDLMDLGMQLMLGRVHLAHHEEGPLAAAVRHFDVLMKLRRAERLLQSMHQRLLSLYPDVSEALVEEARHVHGQVDALVDAADAETVLPALEEVLERVVGLVVWTRHEV
jgi:phosphate uptake regulator